MQFDFFLSKVELETSSHKQTVCNRCKKSFDRDISNFAIKRVTLNSKEEKTEWFSNTCRSCEQRGSVVSSILRKRFLSRRGDSCDCCGRKTDKLRLDHDHSTETFRGWICDNCNTGIGRLGDNISGVRKAMKYLERTEH